MNPTIIELVALIAIFLGALTRTLLPAIRKKGEQDEAFVWDNKYTITLIVTIVIALVAAILTFPTYIIPATDSIVAIFTGAFIFGMGLNAVINEITEWAT